MIQQSYSLVFTQMSGKLTSPHKPVHECLQELYSQLPKLGTTKTSFKKQMDEQTVTVIQWKTMFILQFYALYAY